MNKKRFSFKSSLMMISLAGLFVFGFTSCADDITQGQTEKENGTLTTSEGTGERITFAETEIGLNDTGLTDGMTRAITMYDIKTQKPNINLQDLVNKGASKIYVVVALRKAGMTNDQVTYILGKATVKYMPGKGYRVNLDKITARLREGGWSDDYYVQYTLSDVTPRMVRVNGYNTFVYDMKDINENGMVYPTGDYNTDGLRRDAQIKGMVWATRWKKPIKNGNGELTLASHPSTLDFFYPQGILIKVSGTNRTTHTLTLKGVDIKTNGLAVRGTFEPGKVKTGYENNFGGTAREILFTPSVSTNAMPTDSEIKEGYLSSDNILRLKYDLADPNARPGDKYVAVESGKEMRPYYIWAYPIVNGRTDEMNKYMEFTYKYGPEDGATSTMPVTALRSKNFGNQFWFKNNLTYDVSGVGYKNPTEPMITEFFHFNPYGSNCTMIEVSNPTGKSIDLRDYSFIRLRAFGETTGPGFHGIDHWDKNNLLNEIVPWDLWIDPNTTSGSINQTKLNGNPSKNRIVYKYFYNTENNARGDKGYMLEPGQSVIYCGYRIGKAVYNNDTKYLPDDPENMFKFTPGFINQQIARNKCKFIMACKNAIFLTPFGNATFDSDNNTEFQHSQYSSTLTHGTKQAILLINKKKTTTTKDGTVLPFKIIDATAPCVDYLIDSKIDDEAVWRGQAGLYNTFISTYKLDTFAASADRDDYDLIRRPHVIYPSVRFGFDINPNGDHTHSEWDFYILRNDNNASLPQAKTAEEKGPKHNWGVAFE